MIAEPNQDRLEAEGGICIMYTHFAKGFCEDGVLSLQEFRTINATAGKEEWVVCPRGYVTRLPTTGTNAVDYPVKRIDAHGAQMAANQTPSRHVIIMHTYSRMASPVIKFSCEKSPLWEGAYSRFSKCLRCPSTH